MVASVGSLLTAFGLDSAAGIAAGLYYLPHSTFAAAALFLLADLIARRRGDLADRLDPGPAIARPAAARAVCSSSPRSPWRVCRRCPASSASS